MFKVGDRVRVYGEGKICTIVDVKRADSLAEIDLSNELPPELKAFITGPATESTLVLVGDAPKICIIEDSDGEQRWIRATRLELVS